MKDVAEFPSPQGGSETAGQRKNPQVGPKVSIPSRRVGDQNYIIEIDETGKVSIPSRRVGDLVVGTGLIGRVGGFHPLKAGRRPA